MKLYFLAKLYDGRGRSLAFHCGYDLSLSWCQGENV
jgi:hypothetical protein